MTQQHEPEIARRNRETWDRWSDGYQAKHGDLLDGQNAEAWGLWRRPESELRVLGDVTGRDVLEIGCGAAAWSHSLAKRGARVTALDISARQLAHARVNTTKNTVRLSAVLANAEILPFREQSFDIVFSDYGAMSWADPMRTVPEVARVLRPGGLLAFCANSPLFAMCWNADTRELLPQLRQSYFTLYTRKVAADAVDYVLPYGEWIDLFRRNGMLVQRLIEQSPDADAVTTFADRPASWYTRWPLEVIWQVRRCDSQHHEAQAFTRGK